MRNENYLACTLIFFVASMYGMENDQLSDITYIINSVAGENRPLVANNYYTFIKQKLIKCQKCPKNPTNKEIKLALLKNIFTQNTIKCAYNKKKTSDEELQNALDDLIIHINNERNELTFSNFLGFTCSTLISLCTCGQSNDQNGN